MIIQEIITVKLNGSTIPYYESLGYIIPKNYQYSKWSVKQGTTIKIKVKDLPQNSINLVKCQCDNCKIINEVRYSTLDKSGKYLCKKCSAKNIERRNKISQSSKGKIVTKEQRNKISKTLTGKYVGELNPYYNHEISSEERITNKNRVLVPGYYLWRNSVIKRDNYTCQCCGSMKYLRTHHKNCYEDFKEQRTEINNGITLCKECHNKFHHEYGWRHNTSEHLLEFLNEYGTI